MRHQELCFSAFVLGAAIASDNCRHSRNMRPEPGGCENPETSKLNTRVRFPSPSSAHVVDADEPRWSITMVLNPVEKLRNAVDLIVVSSVWELLHLSLKIAQPCCALWQENLSGFDLGCLSMMHNCVIRIEDGSAVKIHAQRSDNGIHVNAAVPISKYRATKRGTVCLRYFHDRHPSE
jgi:hypothetical protein